MVMFVAMMPVMAVALVFRVVVFVMVTVVEVVFV